MLEMGTPNVRTSPFKYQDTNILNISSVLQSANATPSRDPCDVMDLSNVDNLLKFLDEQTEDDRQAEKIEPLFPQPDISWSEDILMTLGSLFPDSIPDFDANKCTDTLSSVDSMVNISSKDTTFGYDDFCAVLTRHSEPQRAADSLQLPPELGDNKIYENHIDYDMAIVLPPRKSNRANGKVRTTQPKRKTRKKKNDNAPVPYTRNSSRTSRDSISSECLDPSRQKLNGVVSESLNKNASELVRKVASGTGYMSEFAKFVCMVNEDDSDRILPDPAGYSKCVYRSLNPPKQQIGAGTESEKLSKRRRVSFCSDDSSRGPTSVHVRANSSQRRPSRTPACQCCIGEGVNLSKTRQKRNQNCATKQTDKNLRESSHFSSRSVITTLAFKYERLRLLQRQLFHLLCVLFPAIRDWSHITPYSQSFDLLVDEVIDSLKTCSGEKRAMQVRRICCPTVTLCASPTPCLATLQQKTLCLVQLLLPSAGLSDLDPDEIEIVLDQIIAINETRACS